MQFLPTRPAIVAILTLASAASVAHAGGGRRPTSLERYGIGGRAQAVGLHHGFRVETVAVDSAADRDSLRADDVIVKVDGEDIRSYDQMRAALAEAYVEGGEVAITYLRGGSLEQRTMKAHLKPAPKRRAEADGDDEKPAPKRRAAAGDDEDDKPAPKRRAAASDEDEKPAPKRWRASAGDDPR